MAFVLAARHGKAAHRADDRRVGKGGLRRDDGVGDVMIDRLLEKVS